MPEADILNRLVVGWLSLALEYAAGADHVRAVYVYASSERIGRSGTRFSNVYFDQGGCVLTPEDLRGADTSKQRVIDVQRLLLKDLADAELEFERAQLPSPTEYRVYYEPETRKTDVQLARENKYLLNDDLSPRHGIRYWLGDRAPEGI